MSQDTVDLVSDFEYKICNMNKQECKKAAME